MKCPECLNPVETGAFTCKACGFVLGAACGYCKTVNRPASKFCCACGRPLDFSSESSSLSAHASHTARPPMPIAADKPAIHTGFSQRKWVTVLFSDLSGYSALCERLDPEDVREMMNLVFKEIVSIIVRYEGYIDRIIGDEVLAVFGIPQTHEDDPVRAIRAAMEIHHTVPKMTGRFKKNLEKPLGMHSGIATGLVVTGKADLKSGRHGLTGDTVNRASMLTDLAATGEILVESGTMSATSGFYEFETRECRAGSETVEPIQAHRVVRSLERPEKIRRVQGLNARLVGRSGPMESLGRQLATVMQGDGGCVLLEGEAGTGKSRLIWEFKKTLHGKSVRWLQGNAYAFSRNVPYLPIIDLLKRAINVRDEDSQDEVRKKLADELATIGDTSGARFQIVEQLFTLSGDNAPYIPPESWKIQLRQTLVRMIERQCRIKTTLICIEDLHWADPSTVDLLKKMINETHLPVFFLISYRPEATNFGPGQLSSEYYHRQLIRLEDLPPEKSEEMARSLLRSDRVPSRLLGFISDQLSGNPFFLEEAVNSLVDEGTLVKKGGRWEISGEIGDTAFSSGISAVIAARLDRLGEPTRQILQEASVIGREFSSVILKQVSAEPTHVDRSLVLLKSLGLIRRDAVGEKRYRFKHALIQDVAYKSLLKRQRRDLHEKIARVLEIVSPDRIEALCETLAYHFSNGHSVHKAIFYLQQSGRKGFKKSAVIESHNYYEKAYRMLTDRDRLLEDASRRTVELLLEWFFVFNMRGRYTDALALMKLHESDAMENVDPRLKGMYLACLGWAHQRREQLNRSRQCLMEALTIGERIHNYEVIAYSCACLIWTCTDLGRLDEALVFAARAEEASRFFETEDPKWSFELDQDLVRFVLTGTAIAQWFKGDCRQCRHLADRLLAYGKNAGDMNSISEGYLAQGMGRFAAGDYQGAIEFCLKAIDCSTDPLYAFNARFLMAYAYLSLDDVSRAKENLDEITRFCDSSGYEYIGTSATALSSVVAVARGRLWFGVRAIRKHIKRSLAEGKVYHAQTFHFILGSIYLKLALRQGKLAGWAMLRNFPFLILHLPKASGKAEYHFKTAIRLADRIEALGVKAQACLDLGRLYKYRRQYDLAEPLIRQSVALFDKLGADHHLQQAKAELNSFQPNFVKPK
jgi:class 3 adenylate cyclase/tetratricopeptide (TPR) repeat protein